jgi:NADH:ubiquinone oxidoreductase subunit H
MKKGRTYKQTEYEDNLVKIIILGDKGDNSTYKIIVSLKTCPTKLSDEILNTLATMSLLVLLKSLGSVEKVSTHQHT